MKRHLQYNLLSMLILLLAVVPVCTAADPPRETVSIKVGGTRIIDHQDAIKRTAVVNPDIADIVIISPKEFYVYGKQPGYTTIILWIEGQGKKLLDVVVALDLTALKEKLYRLFPGEKVEVHGSETGVVLSGTVSGPEVVEQVLRLTRTFLPRLAKGEEGKPGTGHSGDGITNLLRVGGLQQVLLEVKFAEVTRNSNRDWQAGFDLGDIGGAFKDNSIIAGLDMIGGVLNDPGSLIVNFTGTRNIFVNIDDLTAALKLLETEGLARVLAEPRLVTQNGKEASFLAGGEFPIPVSQDYGEVTIEFKEFGVALRFTPIILGDGKISLRVAPSVSQITSVGSVPSGIVGANFVVPTFSTRKLDTTVELYDGQTIALAGLLQDDLREQVDKIPGLGDIPILGTLFRSTAYQQEKTDLLIAVTPHLVKPVKEGELSFPGEQMTLPNRFDFYLNGRLEGHRGRHGEVKLNKHLLNAMARTSGKGGLEGQFGHEAIAEPKGE